MVTKVCSEMTDPKDGAGVESIANEPCKLDKYGKSVSLSYFPCCMRARKTSFHLKNCFDT
jgi:hypothetical protein